MTTAAATERRSVLALGLRSAVGLVLVVAGWVGARGEVALDRQAPWVAVTVVGAVVAAASAALWLLSFRRSVKLRVLAVIAAVEALPEAGPEGGDDHVRVRVRGGSARLFHRPTCPLVAGRTVTRADHAKWAARGLEPCEACQA